MLSSNDDVVGRLVNDGDGGELMIASQPASHSNPIDMSARVLRSGERWDICAPALMEGKYSSVL